MPTVEARDLGKSYGSRTVLEGVSFTVPPGTVTGLVGENGAGKSTVIGLMVGLLRGTGETRFDGRRFTDLECPARVVGVVTDSRPTIPWWSARRHLELLAPAAGADRSRVEELLELTGLAHAADRPARGYSLGMRQRLSIAAALLGGPSVLVLDEPMIGLDPPGLRWLRALLRDVAGAGGAVLVSSHHLPDLDDVVDDVVVLHGGRLVADGPVREYVARHTRALVRVRSDDLGRLLELVARIGGRVVDSPAEAAERTAADTAHLTGVTPREVAVVALAHGILVHELVLETGRLQEAFLASRAAVVS